MQNAQGVEGIIYTLTSQLYILKVLFDHKVLPLSIGNGPNSKFSIDEVIEKNIVYKQLEESFLELFIYTIPNSDDADPTKLSPDELLQRSTLYSSLKVDLLTIAIGPEHHDIVLVEPKRSNVQIGRISYCVSCSHIKKISLKIQSVNLQFNSVLKNELALKLKFKTSKKQKETVYTQLLESQPNPKEKITSYEYHPLTLNENNLKLESKLSMNELRGADVSVNIYSTRLIEFNRRNSYTLITKRMGSISKSKTRLNKELNLVTYYTLMGFSTLNFYKILHKNDSNLLKQTSKFFQSMSNKNQWNQLKNDNAVKENFKFQVFETLNETYEELIYSKGTCMGKISMKIEVANIPLIRQIMCGVMTETGFEINSIFLYDNALISNTDTMTKYNSLPYDLQTLMKQKNQLELEIANKTQLRSVSQCEKDFNSEILKYLRDIRNSLEKSIEEGCLYYGYSNSQDLFQGQAIMLELGLNCLEIIDKLNMEQRTVCFEILRLINERSEFDLGILSLRWFTEKKQNDVPQVVFNDNILIEKKIIESFIQFNNEALRLSLECISRGKNIDNDSKQFSLFFLSSAYFRIPSYRDSFIKSILKGINQSTKNPKQITQTTSIDDVIDLDPINSLILWDKLFYKKLTSSLKSIQLENEIHDQLKEMNSIISSTDSYSRKGDWKDRLGKRDSVFFDLIYTLDVFLQKKISSQVDINWLNIPGFESIIVAISHELKERDVKSYPHHLIQIIPMFTNNITLINSFTELILNRTNVFDINGVFNAMGFLDLLFNQYESRPNSEQFKSKFNYNSLFAALKAIILSEHSLSLSKCLWFYYKNAHLMSIGHLTEIINSVFLNHYYTLFFHWSWQIRNIFYYLILYTFSHRLKKMLPVVSETEHHSILYRQSSQKFSNGNDMSYADLFDSKMNPIKEIQNIIYTEELNPSFNSQLDLKEFQNILVIIPENLHSNILVSMTHYGKIEEEFSEWIKKISKNGANSPVQYPVVNIVPPRDDIVDYEPGC